MSNKKSFAVRRFRNRNGVFSFRVDGRLHGVRIRRNFKTKEEAAAEKATLELKALQANSGLQSVTTFLNTDQLREAESAFRRLQRKPRSLTFYLDFALANYREAVAHKTLTEAVSEYITVKEYELEQDLISEPYLVRLRSEMNRLPIRYPVVSISELTPAGLAAYFAFGCASPKTYNNRRGILSGFLKFAIQKEWLIENPLSKIPAQRLRRRRGVAQTLTATAAGELMEFVETNHPAAVPFFALCLFAGIRPCLRTGEIVRLKPEHVRLSEGIIRIDGEVSKVREPRTITIQPCLSAWLRAYPLEDFPIVPANLQHLREKAVGKFNLAHDVMRHTFISMFVGKYRSLGEAALQAGNSESIIRKHYLDQKSAAEAEQFFNIMPKRLPVTEVLPIAV